MIKVNALTRTYGEFTAVNQVSFEIGHGEIVGLLGHNGAGKTTIMKMLTGYLEPTAGSIEVDGLVMPNDREHIQQTIGYLPENCPVYPEMTVIDYLEYAAVLHGVSESERMDRVREAMRKTELTEKATRLISILSRGYRQRTGVAQAILHHPRILILDEPTNGLDPTQIQHMRELILELANEATVILSTHILQEVQAICDRVLIIRSGRMALDATMEQLTGYKRLLVAVDSLPDIMQPVLNAIDGVTRVETLLPEGQRQRYAVSVEGSDLDDVAVLVSKTLINNGSKLYSLQAEQHNLETVFGEISARGKAEVNYG